MPEGEMIVDLLLLLGALVVGAVWYVIKGGSE